MDNLTLLDCSLRDGGYRTNWHFSKDRVRSLLALDRRVGVELVELGFLNPTRNPDHGPFSVVTNKLAELFGTDELQLGYMVEAKTAEGFESFNSFAQFAVEDKRQFSFMRIAATQNDQALCRELSLRAIDAGLDVYVNLMRASELSPSDVRKFFSEIPITVKGFYLADSFGSLTPEQTEAIVSELVNFSEVPVGFHAHNNRSMAFANVRSAVKAGAILIDGTWAGHGRGSGNARLEELITEFSPETLTEQSIFALGSHLETYEYDGIRLRDESSFAYHFGAFKGVHPNAVTDLLDTRRALSLGEMLQILLKQGYLNDENVDADDLLRSNSRESKGDFLVPVEQISGRTCILVGNSPGAGEALLEVELAQPRQDVTVCSINGAVQEMSFTPDLVFLLHPYREQQLQHDFKDRLPVVVSPLEKPVGFAGDWASIPLVKASHFGNQEFALEVPVETTLAYALSALLFSGAREIVLVGIGGGLEEERLVEERKLLQDFSQSHPGVKIFELGQTNYSFPQAELW